MGAKPAKWMGVCACGLAILGTAACEGPWGDGSYGDGCYTEATCEPVFIHISGDDCNGQGTPIEAQGEDARCVLEQLRNGETGVVYINVTPDPGWCGIQYVAHVIPDRRAVVVEYDYHDLASYTSMKKAVLRPPWEYQKCLDDGPEGYAACLVNAFGYRSGTPVCECDYCEYE
jgi:hypothetical protein